MNREGMSEKYMRGSGVEFGAFHHPWPIRNQSKVLYVDTRSTEHLIDWIKKDPNLNPKEYYLKHLVPTGLIDSAESCSKIEDQSQDFVIASHVIEHCFDPIMAIKNWLNILKPGGVIFLAAPHKDFCFDRERPLTTFESLWDLYQTLPYDQREEIRRRLIWDYKRIVDKLTGEALEEEAKLTFENRWDIHFHVWNHETFRNFLEELRKLYFDFSILEYHHVGHEMLAVLRK